LVKLDARNHFRIGTDRKLLVESFTAITLAVYRLNSSLIKKSSSKANKTGPLSAPAPSPWLSIIDMMMDAVCLYPMDNIGYKARCEVWVYPFPRNNKGNECPCPEAIAAHHSQGDGQGLLMPNGQHLVQTEGRDFTCCEA